MWHRTGYNIVFSLLLLLLLFLCMLLPPFTPAICLLSAGRLVTDHSNYPDLGWLCKDSGQSDVSTVTVVVVPKLLRYTLISGFLLWSSLSLTEVYDFQFFLRSLTSIKETLNCVRSRSVLLLPLYTFLNQRQAKRALTWCYLIFFSLVDVLYHMMRWFSWEWSEWIIQPHGHWGWAQIRISTAARLESEWTGKGKERTLVVPLVLWLMGWNGPSHVKNKPLNKFAPNDQSQSQCVHKTTVWMTKCQCSISVPHTLSSKWHRKRMSFSLSLGVCQSPLGAVTHWLDARCLFSVSQQRVQVGPLMINTAHCDAALRHDSLNATMQDSQIIFCCLISSHKHVQPKAAQLLRICGRCEVFLPNYT